MVVNIILGLCNNLSKKGHHYGLASKSPIQHLSKCKILNAECSSYGSESQRVKPKIQSQKKGLSKILWLRKVRVGHPCERRGQDLFNWLSISLKKMQYSWRLLRFAQNIAKPLWQAGYRAFRLSEMDSHFFSFQLYCKCHCGGFFDHRIIAKTPLKKD